jgi:hypothetical protein
VEPLIAALGDKDLLVRWTAAESLGKIGDKRAVFPLVAALAERDVREAASEALSLLGWKPSKLDPAAGSSATAAEPAVEPAAGSSATAVEPAGVGAIEVHAGQPLVGVFRIRPEGAGLDDDHYVLEPDVVATGE